MWLRRWPRRFADNAGRPGTQGAKRQADLAGQRHGVRAARDEQIAREQPLDGSRRRLHLHDPIGAFHLPGRWSPHQGVEEFDDLRRRLGKGPLEGFWSQGGEFGADVDTTRTEPTRRRAEGVARRPNQPVGIIAPGQGESDEAPERGLNGLAEFRIETGEDVFDSGGFRKRRKGFGDLKREGIQGVQGAGD